MLSRIRDPSVNQKLNNDYAFWQDDSFKRAYKVDYVLFDGTTYEKLWEKSYQAEGSGRTKTDIIDVYSDRFWATDYGRAISDVNQTLTYDLHSHGVFAHLARSYILKTTRSLLFGKAHGLQQGQF